MLGLSLTQAIVMYGYVNAELMILKTACARARDQSMNIQRLASAAPPAKRQATEAALATALRPSHALQAAKTPMSDTRPTQTESALHMQGTPPRQEVSKRAADEQTAADAQSSPPQEPAAASTSAAVMEGPSVMTAQAEQGTVIDLNAPAIADPQPPQRPTPV